MVAGDALCALEGQDVFSVLPIVDDLRWSKQKNTATSVLEETYTQT